MSKVDSKIGDLPRASKVDDDSLFVMEQQSEALAVEGGLIADFVRDAAEADVQKAVDAASTAQTAADRAEAARDSIVVDEAKLSQAVSSATASATSAKTSEVNAAASETAAANSAALARAEADRATIPAVAGVYNTILTDSVTGERYALIVENGRPALLGVSETLEATDMVFIDHATGSSYIMGVENGRPYIQEV